MRFPRRAPHAALTEFAQRQGDFAIVAAAVSLTLDDGQVTGGRVVLGGVDPLPVVADVPLAGRPATEETWRAAGEEAARLIDPPSDGHGSTEYRTTLAATLVARALAEAAGRPGTGVNGAGA